MDLEFVQGLFQFLTREEESCLIEISDSIDTYQAIGNQSMLSLYLTLLAEGYCRLGKIDQTAQLLQQAEDFIEETGERFYQAEVLRVKGMLMEATSTSEEAEACYMDALQLARKQKAKTLELRAATSLARLWKGQQRSDEAYQVLAKVYNWFTEGFDTADLKEALTLLERLGGTFDKDE